MSEELRCPTCGSKHITDLDGYATVLRCKECGELFSENMNKEDSE
jgi:uncharacterized Zn finger protein